MPNLGHRLTINKIIPTQTQKGYYQPTYDKSKSAWLTDFNSIILLKVLDEKNGDYLFIYLFLFVRP